MPATVGAAQRMQRFVTTGRLVDAPLRQTPRDPLWHRRHIDTPPLLTERVQTSRGGHQGAHRMDTELRPGCEGRTAADIAGKNQEGGQNNRTAGSDPVCHCRRVGEDNG